MCFKLCFSYQVVVVAVVVVVVSSQKPLRETDSIIYNQLFKTHIGIKQLCNLI